MASLSDDLRNWVMGWFGPCREVLLHSSFVICKLLQVLHILSTKWEAHSVNCILSTMSVHSVTSWHRQKKRPSSSPRPTISEPSWWSELMAQQPGQLLVLLAARMSPFAAGLAVFPHKSSENWLWMRPHMEQKPRPFPSPCAERDAPLRAWCLLEVFQGPRPALPVIPQAQHFILYFPPRAGGNE